MGDLNKMTRKKSLVPSRRIRELIEEGTVDCYGVDEEYSGLMTMLENELYLPFDALVVGEKVKVTDFEWGGGGYSMRFVCKRKADGGKKTVQRGEQLEWQARRMAAPREATSTREFFSTGGLRERPIESTPPLSNGLTNCPKAMNG